MTAEIEKLCSSRAVSEMTDGARCEELIDVQNKIKAGDAANWLANRLAARETELSRALANSLLAEYKKKKETQDNE